MTDKKFIPKKRTDAKALSSVYVSLETKAWLKNRAEKHDMTMIDLVDDMVEFCKANEPTTRKNALQQELDV